MLLDTVFMYAAAIGGVVLVFQVVMIMMGFGDDGADMDIGGGDGGLDLDIDADLGDFGDVDHHSPSSAGHITGGWFYEMISLRTLSAAAAFFGIVGKTAQANGVSNGPAFILASAAGFGAMYGMYWTFKQVFKLETAGNENIRNALGKSARVYVPIPGNDQGAGKVQFKMQNRLVEYQAVTEEDDRLPTGENVVVVGIVNSDTVLVARSEQLAEA